MRRTVRTSVLLCLTLIAALVVTGFVSSAYKRERVSLGKGHFERGRQFARQGLEDSAVEEYRQALIFSPDIEEYRLELAKALTSEGQLDEAQSHLEQLAQENPNNGSINVALAQIAVRRKKTQAAINYYHRAVYEYWQPERLPERRAARWELIGLLEAEHKRTEIIGELMQMYAGMPADPRQREKVGFLLLRNDAVSEASQVFRDMLHDSPLDPAGHQGMAEVNLRLGEFLEARHEYQRALHLRPNDKPVQEGLALTNNVIDMDPELPHITAKERLRRSRNLLRAVVTDLQRCSRTHLLPDDLDKELADGNKSLTSKGKPTEDISLDLQDRAQSLWTKRKLFCGTLPNDNRAIEIAIARVGE